MMEHPLTRTNSTRSHSLLVKFMQRIQHFSGSGFFEYWAVAQTLLVAVPDAVYWDGRFGDEKFKIIT